MAREKGNKMIFDKMCQIIERYYPQLKSKVDETRLFICDDNIDGMCKWKNEMDESQLSMCINNSFIPFNSTCVCTKSGCVMFSDKFDNQKGCEQNRDYIALVKSDMGYVFYAGSFSITVCLKYAGIEYDGKYRKVKYDDSDSKLNLDMFRFVFNYFWFTQYINQPCKFIVEDRPLKTVTHKGKIARSGDRPQYTLLTPGEIHTRYAPSGSMEMTGQTRAPHERRRHLRTYTAECYKKMKGQQQWIPACWVGPSEFVKGRRIYKVMLDI